MVRIDTDPYTHRGDFPEPVGQGVWLFIDADGDEHWLDGDYDTVVDRLPEGDYRLDQASTGYRG